MEASINWEDDSSVIEFTMNQKKGETGEFEFKAGIAVVSIGRMHAILPDFLATGQLAYERRQVVGNPYHGNILLKASVDSRTKKLIIAGICLAVVGSNQR
ncbi:MAG: hypothetical protein FJY85_03595 [Deltaproteobacteria bacterium]|nr:hypothetical protein [Deltaproteobacteria bacterium]